MATATTSAAPQFDYISAIKSGYDLWNNNVSAGNARTVAGDSAKNWTNQMNNAETSQTGLSGLISSLGSGLAVNKPKGVLPSSTTSYVDANKAVNTVAPFDGYSAGDRSGMLSAMSQAQGAAGQRVGIDGYNNDNVKQAADRKYTSAVGGIDRAATIASSQGFAKALNGGMADSTAAATQSNTMSRDFADLYAKLREESDTSALAENQSQYKSYLEGQGAQVDQNSRIAQALNQTYSTASSKSANADGVYANASNASADRALKALQSQDDSFLKQEQNDIQAAGQNKSLLANLYSTYGSNQNNLVDSAFKRYATDATGAAAATQGQGSAQRNLVENLMANPTISGLVKRVGDPVAKAIEGLVERGITGVGDVISNLMNPAVNDFGISTSNGSSFDINDFDSGYDSDSDWYDSDSDWSFWN